MDFRLHAVCDRFILDVANLRFLAACVPSPGPERKVPATGWTIRQTFFHIAEAMASYAEMVASYRGDASTATDEEPEDVRNARQIADAGSVSLEEIIERLARARDAFLAAMAGASGEPGTVDEEVVSTLHEWSRHASGHALEIVEALGAVRFDPFLLNWLAGCDLPSGEDHAIRRERLLRDAQSYYDTLSARGPA